MLENYIIMGDAVMKVRKHSKFMLLILASMLIIGVVLHFSTVFAASNNASPTVDNTELSNETTKPDALKERGKQLRVAIDTKYKESSDANKSVDDTEITSIVMQYIPVGMPFDDAKEILHGAGLAIHPYPILKTREILPKEFEFLAEISPYLSSFGASTDFFLSLSTQGAGKLRKISKIRAEFFTTSL